MKFRFLGNYTGGRDSISMGGGVTFHDRAPSEVSDPELVRRLKNNPEFHAVTEHAPAPKADKPKAKRAKKK